MIANKTVQGAVQGAKPWVERLSRLGYATKGMVYVIVGSLAFQAALGTGGETTDSRGVLETIFRQHWGRVQLLLIAVGLFGYMVWRLTEAIFDIEDKGRDARGLLKRAGYALSGLAYGSLALTALQLVLGLTTSGSGDSSQVWTGRLLALPVVGRWLVAAVGAAAAAIGVNAAYVAVTGMFLKKIRTEQMSEDGQRWTRVAGIIGLCARGIVLGIVGYFFLSAAWTYNASRAGDSAQAMSFVERFPGGSWLLAVLAVGVVVYGLYALLVQSRYREMNL